ncbi:DUF3995 domain-containing protein [Cryptosporangium arvum]|uniref:DUF3995 domain-containing protein n=1 Tax=Cryptosporangium arvum TaxID=80871 RepID=UPI0004B18B9E|nr:DUF3995 domain-containing protein [Cryptosporangium arvum]
MNRPAVLALGCTAVYGGLKLFWALGGTAGLRQVPLPPDAIRDALDRTPGAVLGHWLSVAAAALGIAAALLLMRPVPRRGMRRLLGVALGVVAVGMVLRAVLQSIGDVQRLLAGVSPEAAATARWDLFLWSPYFLLWGVCWALAVRHRDAGRVSATLVRPVPPGEREGSGG